MRRSFQQRAFWTLVGLGTVPMVLALLALAWEVRSSAAGSGPRTALEDAVGSGSALIAALDTASLPTATRAALDTHAATLRRGVTMARRAETLRPVAAGGLALVVVIGTGLVAGISLRWARRWSRALSAPIDELVRWVGYIETAQPLPPSDPATEGFSEFASLCTALRGMAQDLDAARRRERERERLVAFRDVARRVAHEIRGPLSAARLALGELGRGSSASAQQVLTEEIDRLDDLAEEFATFGRLPEGPVTRIDLGELVEDVVAAAVPHRVRVHRRNLDAAVVQGRYEPLRRAVLNVIRNALDAGGDGDIDIGAERRGDRVVLRIADHGPGIDPVARDRLFDPDVSTKAGGTGLGLAITRQAVEHEGGRVEVADTPGGGATFVITLPAPP